LKRPVFKIMLILLLITVLTSVFNVHPVKTSRITSKREHGNWGSYGQRAVDVKCWVNYFDNAESAGWILMGDSPYLHDAEDSYIMSVGTGNCSWFHFKNTSLTTLQTVYLMIEWQATHIMPEEEAKLYLDNGVSEVDLGSFNLALEYRWTKINVTSTLKTISEINDAKLKVASLYFGLYLVTVRRAYIRIYNGPVPVQTGTVMYHKVGHDVTLSVQWIDPDELSSYALNHNASGSWILENLTGALTGIEAWSNHTVTLQNDASSVLAYRFWANDTNDNWEKTDLFCVYPVKNFSPDLLQCIEDVSDSSIAHSYGRKDFFDNVTGRFWKFYSDGGNIKYTSTEDGQMWSASQTVRSAEYGYMFYVHGSNGAVHYVYSPEGPGDDVYYRKGILNSNGTITFITSEQVAVDAGTSQCFYACSVVTDTNGYPYIVFGNRTNPNLKTLNLVKSSFNNGTWRTASGFPKKINDNSDIDLVSGVALSLPNNEIYVIYCSANNDEPPRGRLWDNSALGPLENASDYTMPSNYLFSAVSDGYGHIHIVYRKTTNRGDYSFRNYTTGNWEVKDELVTSHLTKESLSSNIYSWPTICWNPDAEQIYVHWWTKEDKSAWLKIRNSTAWKPRQRILRLNRDVTLVRDSALIVPQSYQNKTLINFLMQNVTDEQKEVWAYLHTNISPVASFNESAETVYTSETINFNASASYDSDGSIVSYYWDFGDASNATGVVVDHAYAEDGNYTVILTVTDDDDATDTVSATKTVLNRPPVASFTESAETVHTGDTITFNATDSYDPDGSIVSYFWDFGDGANATGVIAAHSYADNGTYTVTLAVTDDDGAIASANAVKTILNRTPIASFTESTETVYVGEVIYFNASQSYDPDGYIIGYFWDFGDCVNATGITAEHSYAENGTYMVTLTVTDDDGATGNSTSTKTVLRRDVAVLTVTTFKTIVGTGFNVNINVTVENQGDYTETFNVTIYANASSIATKCVTLTSGNSTTLTFTWNTTGFVKGNYSISAVADTVPGETDISDNTLTDGWVVVTIPGDVDGDFDVDLYDAVKLLYSYGAKEGDPDYDPNLDINGNGQIFLFDAVILLTHYGQKDP
jgi:PKD repeat protein